MKRKEMDRLAERLRDAEALVFHVANKLEDLCRPTKDQVRDMQSDLEDAERIVATVAQDLGE